MYSICHLTIYKSWNMYIFMCLLYTLTGCDHLRYGVSCDPCDCNNDTTVKCDHITGNCICMDGWTGGSCTLDIDECDTNTNSCNQTCVNTIGAYVCTCLEGYIVTNGTHCRGRVPLFHSYDLFQSYVLFCSKTWTFVYFEISTITFNQVLHNYIMLYLHQ